MTRLTIPLNLTLIKRFMEAQAAKPENPPLNNIPPISTIETQPEFPVNSPKRVNIK